MNFFKNSQYSIVLIFISIFSLFCGISIGKSIYIQDLINNHNIVDKKLNSQDFNNILKNDNKNDNNIKLLNEAYKIISNKFYSFNSISEKELVY